MKNKQTKTEKLEMNIFLIGVLILNPLLVYLIISFNLSPESQNKAQEIVSVDLAKNTHDANQDSTQANFEPISIQEKIIKIASENDFCIEIALNIAECESQFGKYKHNFSGSTAKGIYQFIDKTWEDYCDGDVLNDEDNIKCFIKLYNKHPNWWACQK